jgi:cytochrome P450
MADAPHRYDLYGDDFKRDPHPTFAAMRRDAPIHRQAGLDGHTAIWFVTRHADVEALLRDPRFVRDPANALPPERIPEPSPLDRALGEHMLNKDGADHGRLRALVGQAFTPRRVADLRPRVAAIAEGLLDQVADRGAMDLIADFAYPLPTVVILEMLGVPVADRDRFRAWGAALVNVPRTAEEGQRAVAQLEAFVAYVRALCDERRAAPKDDLLSALVAAESAGDRLSETELVSTLVLLIVAGHETTVNLLANAVLALAREPAKRDALAADPTRMPAAVEEFLRYDGPVERTFNRWASEDVVWDGHHIAKGDPVIFVVASANRDEARFERPDELDLARAPKQHLAFGKGVHYCLGAPLARLEAEIALNALLARLPNLRLAVPESDLRYRFAPMFRALEALPVAWDPRR